MIILYFLVIFLTSTCNADPMKKCNETAFCSRLRNLVLDEQYKFYADFVAVNRDSDATNMITMSLWNSNGDQLALQITVLPDRKARIRIYETNMTARFELSEVWSLVEEPVIIPFKFTDGHENMTLYPNTTSEENNHYLILNRGPPFTIEFYVEDQLEIVFSGEKFIMDNSNVSTAYAFSVEFEGAEKLYGLFDHAFRLALPETNGSFDPFRMRNCDASADIHYEADSTAALYGAVPVIYGHSENHTAGIFLHNAAQQWVDISYKSKRPTAYFMVESGLLDLFVLLGPTPKEVVRQYTNLTGTAHLPQLWALGYQQCRMSYHSQEDVKSVVALMQENRFPMDAIWLARDHTDGNRWFMWNQTAFSDPVEMQQNISALNKFLVTISDPHIKIDENYTVYTQAKNRYFVKASNNNDYEGICWPGMSSWIDFFLPLGAKYYGSWYAYDKFEGSTPVLAGIWNDMNEPSVFNGTDETTMTNEAIHIINPQGTQVKHRDVHNLYGHMHIKATHQGLLDRDNNAKRPFILTRSHFAGSQRYAAMWTGDNDATWAHFANSFSQCMTGNLLGMVFCGADIGGFFGDTSEELIQRWYQGAVWLPFFRGHSNALSKRREPYLYPENVQDVIRSAIELRYRHIPQFYTLFYEHSRYGDPIIAPVFYYYPGVQELDTQTLIGGDIMAVAVVNASVRLVEVTFPGTDNDLWYRLDSNASAVYFGNNSMKVEVNITSSPVFYRGGSIVVTRDDPKMSTTDTLNDPYRLNFNTDKYFQASGRFYMDDFTSFDYVNDDKYFYFSIDYDGNENMFILSTIDGNFTGFSPTFVIASVTSYITSETGNIEAVTTEYTTTRSGIPLSSLNIGEELNQQMLRTGRNELVIPL